MPAQPSAFAFGGWGGVCAFGKEKELLAISYVLCPLCLISFNSQWL